MYKTAVPFIFLLSLSCNAPKWNPEQQAIIGIIENTYAEGLQNQGDSLAIDKGFHPQFQMIARDQNNPGDLRLYPIRDWRRSAIKRRATGQLPRPDSQKVHLTFEWIDIEGDAAVAKIRYYEGEEHTYIDYITLYRFDQGWRMISKAFHKLGE